MSMRTVAFVVFAFLAGAAVTALGSTLGRTRTWWITQDLKRGTTRDGYDDLVLGLELRRRVGPTLAAVTPGFGTCKSCGAPWSLVHGHTTSYEPGRYMFPICDECFRLLRELGRDDEIAGYYRALAREWFAIGHTPANTESIVDAAVREELGSPRLVSVPSGK